MDTLVTSLPPDVGALLMQNISIIEIVSMFSIGAYNALETVVLIFNAFKRYRGTYFWSMQVAAWGILVHAIPAMTRYVSQASNLAVSIPFMIGWYAMVTGQAVVLYSRLRIVVHDIASLRWILWMIITSSCIFHIPMTVLFFGVNSGDTRFARPAVIYDRIQLTGFCIQDLIICGFYMREAVRSLKRITEWRGRKGRKVMIHLIWVNTIVVFLNILLLVTEYKLHYIQVSFKTVVYSVKLKLEFSVLNRLCTLVQSPLCFCHQGRTQQQQATSENLFNPGPENSRTGSDAKTPLEKDPAHGSPPALSSSAPNFDMALRKAPNDRIVFCGDMSSSSTFCGDLLQESPTGSADSLSLTQSRTAEACPNVDV